LYKLVDVVEHYLNRVVGKTETTLDDMLVPVVRKALRMTITIVAILLISENLLGPDKVKSLFLSAGIGGIAVALAAKDTIANVFGSLVVFTDRPFHVGDWVEVAGIEGTVEEVGFRTTQIRRFDKSGVTVPNSTFSSNPIVNHSRRPIRRIKMTIGLSYQTSAAQMRRFLEQIRELIRNHPDIDQGFNFVYLTEFSDSSLALQVYCFTRSTVWTDFLAAREDLMLSIMDLVEEHGLEIAFPTRTLYLREEAWEGKGLPENSGLSGSPGER
jgi:MscS family membrane protein